MKWFEALHELYEDEVLKGSPLKRPHRSDRTLEVYASRVRAASQNPLVQGMEDSNVTLPLEERLCARLRPLP